MKVDALNADTAETKDIMAGIMELEQCSEQIQISVDVVPTHGLKRILTGTLGCFSTKSELAELAARLDLLEASVVTKDVPPYEIVGGTPARKIGERFPDPEDRARHDAILREPPSRHGAYNPQR